MSALTQRFRDALVFATDCHEGQTRKGSGAPYILHPLQVAGIALEHGADEDQAIAALLHDVLEDTDVPREEIERRFGARVTALVEGCTDTTEKPKPPWLARKKEYLEHLQTADPSLALVSAADKLHNARTILTDYWTKREEVWDQFKGGRDGTLWYYRMLIDALEGKVPAALYDELFRTVRKIYALADAEWPRGRSTGRS